MSNPWPIDRIDDSGNIREHLTIDAIKTLCGMFIHTWQAASDKEDYRNRHCKRCRTLAERAGMAIDAPKTKSEIIWFRIR